MQIQSIAMVFSFIRNRQPLLRKQPDGFLVTQSVSEKPPVLARPRLHIVPPWL